MASAPFRGGARIERYGRGGYAARVSAPARVCFVIPTYNEAANVVPLLERLTDLHPGESATFLIVDDESPDGTGDLVREFAARDGRVRLLEGPKRGLGAAYRRGIAHALDAIGADAVVQMDADFSHDPADARRLLARLAEGADAAIGSRYVTGGGVDERWPARRRWLSAAGNHLARRVAGLGNVRDCTGGFRAIRADALRAAGADRLAVRGYACQVALLHRLLRTGARVVEEPVFFRERARGRTKLGARDAIEFLYCVGRLRLAGRA